MTKIFLTTTAIAIGLGALSAVQAEAGPRAGFWDRVEDRIDRRENRVDERVDHGPRDVIEDRLDRIEDRRDRAGFDGPSRFDRHERRSWWRIWGPNQ